MSFRLVVLGLTVGLLVVLGILAIVSSTSGGVDWLQARWRRPEAEAPGAVDAGSDEGDHPG